MSEFTDEKRAADVCLERRAFLGHCGMALVGLSWFELAAAQSVFAATPPKGDPKQVTIVEFTDAGERKEKLTVPMVRKTDDEWKKLLSPLSFEVTRRAGTERPYTGENPQVHDKGVFRCICCDTALFSSATKFDSGTGWPSFWATIAKENVVESADNSLGTFRTAVSCRRCEAHLGHVFDDGPRLTGLRYCMNSVALRFAKGS
jgi:peptide-methionine (R)-S-oxide reductase